MISEREFYGVLGKDAAVEEAWVAANSACFHTMKRPHGPKDQLARIWWSFVLAARVNKLLHAYNRATGIQHPVSDLDILRAMIENDARDRDGRRFMRTLEGLFEAPPRC